MFLFIVTRILNNNNTKFIKRHDAARGLQRRKNPSLLGDLMHDVFFFLCDEQTKIRTF